jgi:hypothetical protein
VRQSAAYFPKLGINHLLINQIIGAHGMSHITPASREAAERIQRRDQSPRKARRIRRTKMKTMFLALAAVLGIALGTASLIPVAHASSVYLYPPSDSAG